MNQEELKRVILTHTNLDELSKNEIESFFAECEGVTVDNYRQKFDEWRQSEAGAKSIGRLTQKQGCLDDIKFAIGLETIANGNYEVYENTLRLNTYVVRDKTTHLYGLITVDGEEVMPCLFESINVSLSWFIDVRFKGRDYSFGITTCRESKEGWFKYGKKGAYYIEKDIEQVAANGKVRHIFSAEAQQLVNLLKIKHSAKLEKK